MKNNRIRNGTFASSPHHIRLLKAANSHDARRSKGSISYPVFIVILITILSSISCSMAAPPKIAMHNLTAPPEPYIHFPTGGEAMLKEDSSALVENAKWMDDNQDAVIILEGHCDERGGKTFNVELGDRRARFVKAMMIENGVDEERMVMIVSRGESEPLDPKHNWEAWKKNRRVEFIVR